MAGGKKHEMRGAFPLQKWLCKCSTKLCCMYIAFLVLLLALCVFSDSYMNRSWEKSVLFKDAMNAKII
jgi:hypothetical protein